MSNLLSDDRVPPRCPACAAALWADANETYGRLICPRCEADLWFVNVGDETIFIVHDVNHPIIRELESPTGADSLDIVELVMELEEEQRSRGSR